MRITRRGLLRLLRDARLGAAVWLVAFTVGVTAIPLLHTAFHAEAHGHAHVAAHALDEVPAYARLVGFEEALPHRHGDGELHSHGDDLGSTVEELDPLLAMHLQARHSHDAGHGGDHGHPGHSHGDGSLEHLDVALLASTPPALAAPVAALAVLVASCVDAPTCANYLLSPLKPQAPPSSVASS